MQDSLHYLCIEYPLPHHQLLKWHRSELHLKPLPSQLHTGIHHLWTAPPGWWGWSWRFLPLASPFLALYWKAEENSSPGEGGFTCLTPHAPPLVILKTDHLMENFWRNIQQEKWWPIYQQSILNARWAALNWIPKWLSWLVLTLQLLQLNNH